MTLLEMIKAIDAANRIAEQVVFAQALSLYDAGPVHRAGAASAITQARKELAELTALMASDEPFKNAPGPRPDTEVIRPRAPIEAEPHTMSGYSCIINAFPNRDSLAAAINLGQRTGGYSGE